MMEFSRVIFLPFITVSILYLFDRWFFRKRKLFGYYTSILMIMVFLIFLVYFLFPSKASAIEVEGSDSYFCNSPMLEAQEKISFLTEFILEEGVLKRLTAEQKKCFKEKMAFHRREAKKCYEEAKNKCWYLPDINDREKAKQCFIIACASIAPSEPKSKLVAMLVATLINYGLDCIDEWNYIHDKLCWAQYHYEMMEFYQFVLENGEK